MKSIYSRTLMMTFDSVSMSGINLNVIAYVNIKTIIHQAYSVHVYKNVHHERRMESYLHVDWQFSYLPSMSTCTV